MEKIKSLDELKAKVKDGQAAECFLKLWDGIRSWKTISYDESQDKWYILNQIDESKQKLSSEELFDKSLTLIGKAIKEGNFYFAWV